MNNEKHSLLSRSVHAQVTDMKKEELCVIQQLDVYMGTFWCADLSFLNSATAVLCVQHSSCGSVFPVFAVKLKVLNLHSQ